MNGSGKDGRSPRPARRLATRVVTAGRDPGFAALAVAAAAAGR